MNSYTIRLDKNRHGYGLTITGERPCILSSIQQGSPADRAGLKVGDCLVSINDISVKNATHDKVVYMVGSSNCLVLQVTRRLNVDIKNDLKLKNNFIRKASKKYILPRSNTQILNPIGNLGEFTDMAKTEGLTNDNLKVFPFKRNLSVSSRRNRVMYRENVKRENSRVNLATTKRLSQNKRNKIRYLDQQRQVSGDTKISFKSGPIDKEHYSRNIFFVDRPVNFKNNEKTKEFLENRQNIQKAHSSAPATNLLHVYKVIVGYIGTTQLPMSSMFRKFTIQDSVKRLDALKCNYTLMALLLSTQEIRFINSIGKYIAKYSLEDIAYIGRYELDTKFFGIITQNSNTNKYESKSLKSTFPSNNSTHVDCHIFYTDRSLALNHEQHSIIAKKFAFKSTKILQSDNKNSRLMDRICCQEFTLESTPILVNVIKILENYKSKYSKDKLNEKKSMSHINSDSSLNQIQKNIKRIQIGCDNSSEDSSWDSRTGWYNGMLPMEDITTSSLTSFGSSGNNAVEQQWRGFAEKQKLNNLRKHIRSQPLPQSEKKTQLDIDKQLDQDWKIANDQVKSSNSLDLCKMPKNSHFIEKPKITDNWKKSFDCLLNDSIGIKIFTYFLKLEFSEENIKFWISCNEYKNSIQNEVCRKKIGKYIFDTYICQNGIEAININDDTRSAISLNKIYECSNECVLNQAQSEIYTLMKMDSYCRFVTSDIFQDCVNSEKRGEAISIPVKPASLTNLLNQCKVANPTESRRRSLLHWPKVKKPEIFALIKQKSSREMPSPHNAIATDKAVNKKYIIFEVVLPNTKNLFVKSTITKSIRDTLKNIVKKYCQMKIDDVVVLIKKPNKKYSKPIDKATNVGILSKCKILMVPLKEYNYASNNCVDNGDVNCDSINIVKKNDSINGSTSSNIFDEQAKLNFFDNNGVFDPKKKKKTNRLNFIKRNSFVSDKNIKSAMFSLRRPKKLQEPKKTKNEKILNPCELEPVEEVSFKSEVDIKDSGNITHTTDDLITMLNKIQKSRLNDQRMDINLLKDGNRKNVPNVPESESVDSSQTTLHSLIDKYMESTISLNTDSYNSIAIQSNSKNDSTTSLLNVKKFSFSENCLSSNEKYNTNSYLELDQNVTQFSSEKNVSLSADLNSIPYIDYSNCVNDQCVYSESNQNSQNLVTQYCSSVSATTTNIPSIKNLDSKLTKNCNGIFGRQSYI